MMTFKKLPTHKPTTNQYKDKPAQPDFKIYEDNYVAPTQQTQSQPKQEFKPLSEDDLF